MPQRRGKGGIIIDGPMTRRPAQMQEHGNDNKQVDMQLVNPAYTFYDHFVGKDEDA